MRDPDLGNWSWQKFRKAVIAVAPPVCAICGDPQGVPVACRRCRPTVDVIAEARRQGFELEERVLYDQWMWGWRRDDDERWPCFLEHRLTVSWMRDRLARTTVFDR